MIMLKINNIDFSGHVLAGGYKVQSEDVYIPWTNANGIEKRKKYRTRVMGSMDVFFRSMTDYESFAAAVAAKTNSDNAVEVTLTDNRTNQEVTINAFMDYEVVRNIDGMWDDFYESFTIDIEEQ